MGDFKKIFITHFIMVGLIFFLSYSKIFKIDWILIPLTGLMELIIIVILSIKFNVKLKSILIFFIILMLSMLIVAVDSCL